MESQLPGGNKDPKTVKLRRYLDAKIKSDRAGAPQTKTASMLESLLDGTGTTNIKPRRGASSSSSSSSIRSSSRPKIQHQIAKRDDTLMKAKGAATNKTRTGTGTGTHSTGNGESQSIWSQANIQSEAPSKKSPARSLDDLLAPTRPSQKGKLTKMQPMRRLDTRKKAHKSKNGQQTNRNTMVEKNSVVRSSLPSRVVLNIPGSKKASFRKTALIPSSSLTLSKTNTVSQGIATCTTNAKERLNDSTAASLETRKLPVNPIPSPPRGEIASSYDDFTAEKPSQSVAEISTIPSPSSLRQRPPNQGVKPMEGPPPAFTAVQRIIEPLAYSAQSTNDNHGKKRKVNNDNFVRLNMKNNAGACKGARSLKQHNRLKRRRAEWKQRTNQLGVEENEDDDDGEKEKKILRRSTTGKRMTSIQAAIDPLDDFLDGKFHTSTKKKPGAAKQLSSNHPICPRHQRPCKLLVVKKNTSGNKGRKFYVCSMPKGDQCDFFQWEEDTVEAAKRELLHSSSHSGFIARQVAGHVDRLKTLTLPELREEAKKRGLHHTGKKQSVLARLSVWVRDAISASVGVSNSDTSTSGEPDQGEGQHDDESSEDELLLVDDHDDEDEDSDSADDDGCSDDELDITGSDTNGGNALVCDNSESDTKSPLHSSLMKLFGYEDFREGQEWAIRRCLTQEVSLLVAPTGQGKSLCYALPAAMMDGVCIVVSPLVSLMEDQLRHLPPTIPAATLSGTMTAKKLATIIDDLIRNRLKILFVSPERLASAAFRRLLRPKFNPETKSYERQLPPVSLLCVDEAHCLSQWGHNFRVSYLRLRTLLSKINPRSVLALTATAGPPVIKDICHTLHIRNPNHEGENGIEAGTMVLSCNRDNIDVDIEFVNNDENKLSKLLKLLRPSSDKDAKKKTEGALSTGSVIVYVWRQKDAEVISEQLRSYDIEGGIVCYHGGMDANSRTKSQSRFMRGKARVCVATVAFGLGINKADVRGIIHLCLPPSPEHFLQEIGRAGRDGKPATAFALVLDTEIAHKLSLSFSDRLSRGQILALLSNMRHLALDALKDSQQAPSHSYLNVSMPISKMVQSIDCKEESIFTILSILEDGNSKFEKILDIEGTIPDSVTLTLKKRNLVKLSSFEEIARCIQKCCVTLEAESNSNEESSKNDRFSKFGGTASQKGFSAYSFGVYQISIVQCAQLLGGDAEPRHVFAALRRLQDSGELELTFNDGGSSIHLKLNNAGMNFFHDENGIVDVESRINQLSLSIYEHFAAQDQSRAEKVLAMNEIMRRISVEEESLDRNTSKKSARLQLFQTLTSQYFSSTGTATEGNGDYKVNVNNIEESDAQILSSISFDITNLLQHPSLQKKVAYFPETVKFGESGHEDYTALAITKILHGIPSPKTPVLDWYRHPLWGRYRTIHFNSLKNHVQTSL